MSLETSTVLAAYLQLLHAHGVRDIPLSADARAGLNELVRRSRGKAAAPAARPREEPAPAATPAPAQRVAPSPAPAAKPVQQEPAPPPEPAFEITGGSKTEKLRYLAERAAACPKCAKLFTTRTQSVFGVGDPEADLMFVGEAPGAEEDKRGEPFVGPAGQLLTKIIQAMGLSREKVYIANILTCRPDAPVGNRKPTPEEIATCLPYLRAQIDIVAPKVLVALGSTALEGLLGLRGIRKLRGNWQEYRGIPLMPTFHPSYLLRDRGSFTEKRKTWEDMLQVMKKLEMPISEKQQGFFLKK